MSGPSRLGILGNPRSGGNRQGNALAGLLEERPDLPRREAVTPGEVAQALEELLGEGVDLIAVNGGDGTVQAVLTALHRRGLGTGSPAMALLRAGTTSMLARDAGLQGEPAPALRRLLERLDAGPLSAGDLLRRPVLEVTEPSGEVRCGMFFGAGLICHGIELFHGEVNPGGHRGELLPGLLIGRMLLGLLTGSRRLAPPTPIALGCDGEAPLPGERLVVLATTLERLFLGLRPWWGDQDAPLHVSALDARPRWLLPALPFLVRGRPAPWTTPERGYRSRNVIDLRLAFEGSYTLDGELFDHRGELRVRAAGPLRFVRP